MLLKGFTPHHFKMHIKNIFSLLFYKTRTINKLKADFKNGGGFTLVELLISIFILIVGIAAILNIFPFGIQVQKSSQMAVVAAQLSQQKMEEIISKSYKEAPVEVIEEDYGFNPNFSSYKRKTEISYFDPENPETPALSDLGIKKIEVTVFWRSPLAIGEKEVRLATLIVRR